jgi:hypothetical protein
VMMEINEPGDRRFTLTGAGLSPEALKVIAFKATEQISITLQLIHHGRFGPG